MPMKRLIVETGELPIQMNVNKSGSIDKYFDAYFCRKIIAFKQVSYKKLTKLTHRVYDGQSIWSRTIIILLFY